MTHLPTGIRAESRSERSLHKNTATALAMLRGKLHLVTVDRARPPEDRVYDEHGSPISLIQARPVRGYVLDPFTRVSSGPVATNRAADVFDGDIFVFLRSSILSKGN